MNPIKLLSGAVVLGILLEAGCGGTIDLAKLKKTDGSGSTSSSSAGTASGGRDIGAAGDTSIGDLAGYSGISGAPNAGAPNAGAPNGGAPNAGAPNAGAPNAGAPNGGAPNGGAPNGGAPNGGSGGHGDPPPSCLVDDDCTLCETPTDPEISGCYIACCTLWTPMSAAVCAQNWQNYLAICPQIGCAVACAHEPHPLCVNGRCVRGHE